VVQIQHVTARLKRAQRRNRFEIMARGHLHPWPTPQSGNPSHILNIGHDGTLSLMMIKIHNAHFQLLVAGQQPSSLFPWHGISYLLFYSDTSTRSK
jgi:hypothetical protein